MDVSTGINEMICIDYPGVVVNVDKMVQTLGGSSYLSEVFSNNKKLQLRFRPDDKLCKPATAARCRNTTLLLKVKVKKRDKKVLSYNVIGQCKEEFVFPSPSDFQFLAMDNGQDIYEKIIPTKLDPDWLDGDSPPFFIPPLLTKSDVGSLSFSARKLESQNAVDAEAITSTRIRRFGKAIFVSFDAENIPTGPKIVGQVRPQPSAEALDKIKKLLEERPVVSRSVVSNLTGFNSHILREVMPYVSYHFSNGPWRTMWVRFGYDPRKDPTARKYQCLDYRVKNKHDQALISAKRKGWTRDSFADPVKVEQLKRLVPAAEEGDSHILKPGQLPPSRQVFYQYCDIHLPELQALVMTAEVRSDCHFSEGWFPDGTSFAARRIISKYIASIIAKLTTDTSLAQSSSQDYSVSTDTEEDHDFDDQI